MTYGFIYVLSNPSMPGIYKIGHTTKHPKVRMAELSKATACPVPFEMLAFIDHNDSAYAEREIHRELDDFRVNSSREFFMMTLEQVQNKLRQWCDPEGAVVMDWLDHLCEQEVLKLNYMEGYHGQG